MDFCILIPLIVGLICALLGYLIGRLSSKGKDTSSDIELWRNKNVELENALAECKKNLAKTSTTKKTTGATAKVKSNVASSLGATVSVITFNADAAKAAFGKKVKQDDLTIVEGIGPKISELFRENGIATWKSLAEATIPRLQEILNSKGQRYKMHNPKSWPMQSQMAYEGKWAELKKWQDEHDYGKA